MFISFEMGNLVCFYRKAVSCPIIDVISDENFAYLTGSETTYGGFNEKLNFRWYPAPERENRRRGGDKSLAMRFVNPTRIERTKLTFNHHHHLHHCCVSWRLQVVACFWLPCWLSAASCFSQRLSVISFCWLTRNSKVFAFFFKKTRASCFYY